LSYYIHTSTHEHTDRETDCISSSTLSVRQNINILSRSHTTQYTVLTNHQHTTTSQGLY